MRINMETIQGTIVAVQVDPGDAVSAGTTLIVMEAMKMEHTITATHDCLVSAIAVQVGAMLYGNATILAG